MDYTILLCCCSYSVHICVVDCTFWPAQVLVEVYDGGDPVMSDEGQFFIAITDVNDNPPQFSVRI